MMRFYFYRQKGMLALLLLTCAVFCCFADAHIMPGIWKAEQNGKMLSFRKTPERIQELETAFPGGLLIGKEQARYEFRPSHVFFSAARLSFEVFVSGPKQPLKAWIYTKDKDGTWFQSEQEFQLIPDRWNSLTVQLDVPGANLLPKGHNASWNATFASSIFSAGLSLWTEEQTACRIRIREPEFSGKRSIPELNFVQWDLPRTGRKYSMLRSTFRLSREYFNPFNPNEIALDVEVRDPSGKAGEFPAFYTVPHIRKTHFTKEQFTATGIPGWEFRYTPSKPGQYRFRIRVTDQSSGKKVLFSDWKDVRVADSDLRGRVRVAAKNPRYFEFQNGEFYFPVGINIHTNTDQRAEDSFGFGHLPDRGNMDYEEYIKATTENGINLMEVWMAAWTYGLEWSASRVGYQGLGFYNMNAAWRLDHLLDTAAEHGLLINLVLNNHGVLTAFCDPEWYDSPYNSKGIFAAANNAFLDEPEKFWDDPKAIEYSKRKIRYTCARWGAYPNIFAMELWSEVDLVSSGSRCRDDGSMIRWHRMAAKEIRKNTPNGQMVATHVCGEIDNLMNWRALTVDLKELDHICCDAYRARTIPIDTQIKKHQSRLQGIRKPAMITEYGGTVPGPDHANLLADIHGGLWAALFTNHAGTPLLWWHDFIHINRYYDHFAAFSTFIKGLDLRSPEPEFGVCRVDSEFYPGVERKLLFKGRYPKLISEFKPQKLTAMYLRSGAIFLAWIYEPERMEFYPRSPLQVPTKKQGKIHLPNHLPPGDYLASFHDTGTGKELYSKLIRIVKGVPATLDLPEIRIDLALKMRPVTGGKNK